MSGVEGLGEEDLRGVFLYCYLREKLVPKDRWLSCFPQDEGSGALGLLLTREAWITLHTQCIEGPHDRAQSCLPGLSLARCWGLQHFWDLVIDTSLFSSHKNRPPVFQSYRICSCRNGASKVWVSLVSCLVSASFMQNCLQRILPRKDCK